MKEKNCFYSFSSSSILILIFLIVGYFLFGIIAFCYEEIVAGICLIIVFFVFLFPLIIGCRKIFFRKITINEFGIEATYKKEKLVTFLWQDIKIVRVLRNNCIIISNKKIYDGKESHLNYKYNIMFIAKPKACRLLLAHNSNIGSQIENHNLLSKRAQKILLKN